MGILDYLQRVRPQEKGALQKIFYEAAHKGDTPGVLKTIRQGADVTADNNHALKTAFANKNWNTVLLLLNRGADPHVLPGDPLGEAISMSRLNIAKKMVAKGLVLNSSPTAQNSLVRAIKQQDHDLVKWVVAQKDFDIHAGNELALKTAFDQKRWAAATLLLKRGADPKALPFDPLNAAIAGSQFDLAKRLKSHGFALNNTNSAENALLVSLEQYDLEITQWVMNQREIDIHVGKDKALARAMENNRWLAVDLLLDRGADPYNVPFDPLTHAIANGQMELAQNLKDRAFRLVVADKPDNALLVALGQNGRDMVEWVAEQPEIDIHVGNEKPLQAAFGARRWMAVDLFLEKGADPKALKFDPLNAAIANSQHGLAEKLKNKHGMPLNTSSGPDNALLVALGQYNQVLTEWVINQPEIDIHINGEEPLSRALFFKRWKTASLLLDKGADPKALKFDPLRHVITQSNLDLARRFQSMGFALDNSNTASNSILVALDQYDQSMVRWVAAQPGMDVRKIGAKALVKALQNRRWATAEFFMEQGVDPKKVTAADPMKLAVAGSQRDLMQKFLDAGLPVNRTTNGETPLMVAAGRGMMDDVKWLLENKAVVNAQNSGALVRAISKNHFMTARLLLEHGADGTPILGMDLDDEMRRLAEANAIRSSASQMAQMRRLQRRRSNANNRRQRLKHKHQNKKP